ncbi:HNH endonuclease [Peptostreptococcus equinus]|uniref:Putative HNH nuclease YajD n=1 Tax=Peptostreptococcus equinus TaxID=3003601 RepID=A0ABY7JVL8_9FIRM|nr:HNH endonuclease signature motif containing protein [Peptostreptococcus sp. CBA3647]WAW15757.1 HNH endonuclease signature motif containing protein [Peptostreptococcus sp. CBA3647]
MLKFICQECGNEFKGYKTTGGKDRKFCSRECEIKNRTGKQNKNNWKGIWKKCPVCNTKFYVYPYEINIKKTCSKKCKYEYEHKKGIHQGENCNFWKGGYDLYKGANWYHQRKLARERDNNTCQECGKKLKNHHKQMIVHHIVPYRFFMNDYIKANDLNNLITLCHNCHAKQKSHHWLSVPKKYQHLLQGVKPQERVKRKIGINKYTQEEIDFILENKGKMTYKEMSNKINRSVDSIASKVYEINKKR